MDNDTKKRPGRPPKRPEDRRRNTISVRYTDAELDRLERLAAEAGEGVAGYVWRMTRGEVVEGGG